jgi:hypothetical protein
MDLGPMFDRYGQFHCLLMSSDSREGMPWKNWMMASNAGMQFAEPKIRLPLRFWT